MHTSAAGTATVPASIYTGGAAVGTATTVAVLLGLITFVMIWKKVSPRATGIMALLTGLTGASILIGWLGNLATLQVYGVGIMLILAVVGSVIIWHELVKKRGLHRFRTPVIAALTGMALMSVGGLAGNLAHSATNVVTTSVTRVSGSTTGNGG